MNSMFKSYQNMPNELRENMRGGEGIISLQSIFQKGDYDSSTRLFSLITVPVGGSIGFHQHNGEEEFFYFLSGHGEFDDNGTSVSVSAGDATVTRSGEGHALRNTGDIPLELVAVIVTL